MTARGPHTVHPLRAAGPALASWLLVACAPAAPSVSDHWTPDERALVLSLGRPGPPPPSPGNASADDPRAARLGHALFFDPGLSASGALSCAGCHDPARHFTDGRARAQGARALPRNTPTLHGVAPLAFLGWDGRSDSVWSQALRALEDPREMGVDRGALLGHLTERHRAAYEAAFGPLPGPGAEAAEAERVLANVAKALEAYVRRLRLPPAPFDRYVEALARGDARGGGHLSPLATRGLRVFVGEGRCVTCHNGPWLTDGQFHNLGVPGAVDEEGRAAGASLAKVAPFRCGSPASDARGPRDCDELRFLAAAAPELRGAWKTPTLRNVAVTAPYMHAGQLRTLDEVLAFYRSRPGQPTRGVRDPLLRLIPRGLDTAALAAFLEALTSPVPDPAHDPWWGPPASGRPPLTAGAVTDGATGPARPRPSASAPP